jgi:hypothetical protein
MNRYSAVEILIWVVVILVLAVVALKIVSYL